MLTSQFEATQRRLQCTHQLLPNILSDCCNTTATNKEATKMFFLYIEYYLKYQVGRNLEKSHEIHGEMKLLQFSQQSFPCSQVHSSEVHKKM